MGSIAELKPDPENARKHSRRNIDMLVDSLQEVGAARSIVIDEEDMILAGHGVIEAAGLAGIDRMRVIEADGNEIIAVRRSGLSETQKRKLSLYDNRVAELADWNAEMLAGLIAEDEDLLAGMFSADELAELLKDAGNNQGDAPDPQIDRAEELREKWTVEHRQVWEIPSKTVKGKCHRVMCGDSVCEKDVVCLMAEEKVGAIVADPPYGMRLDADFSGMVSNARFFKEKGLLHGRKYDNVIGDDTDFDPRPTIAMFGDPGEQFWFGADYYASRLPDTEHSGAWLVWDKRLDASADKMFGSCFELLWSRRKCRREMLRHKWAGVFGTEKEPQRGRQHPNQKPVVLLIDIIGRTAGIVVDPFLGSGTTMVAAEQTGRVCYGMEIAEKYVAVTLQRLADMGLEPRLTGS